MSADLFTIIPVSYRDAAGWQKNATYVAEGAITEEQTTALRGCVDGDGFFIPTQIGQDHLGQAMEQFPGEDDHIFHVMDVYDVEIVDVLPEYNSLVMVGPVDEFVALMVTEHAKGWDDTVDVDDL
jgi:hypothetical protein